MKRTVSMLCVLLTLGACGGDGSSTSGVDAPVPTAVLAPPPPPPPPPPAQPPQPPPDNLRSDGNDFLAAFRDVDGTSYDARQLGGRPGWVVESTAPLDGLIVYGQSNAGLTVATDTDTRLRKPLFPRTVVGSSLGFYNTNATMSPNLATAPFTDLYDPPAAIGHFPATLDAFAAEQIARDAGRAPTGLYAYTQYQSAQPITAFVKGSVNYQDLIGEIRRTAASAKLYKRSFVVRGIVWVQGERATDNYGATLEQLADDLAADIVATTGQAVRPELLIQQINRHGAQPTVTGVELDQLALAKRRQGTGITMIGPMYQGRFGAADVIHVSDLGKMMLADVVGIVFDRIRRGLSFTPLWPVAVSRSGAVIDIKFNVPGNGLALDKDVLPNDIANYGFVFKEDVPTAFIQSVQIVGSDTVRLTLNQVPAGVNPQVQYALGNEATTDGFSSTRGNLYSEASATSVYYRLGYPVPQRVRHYAVRFAVPVP